MVSSSFGDTFRSLSRPFSSDLEHERETGSRSTRNAFESLGARVTELGRAEPGLSPSGFQPKNDTMGNSEMVILMIFDDIWCDVMFFLIYDDNDIMVIESNQQMGKFNQPNNGDLIKKHVDFNQETCWYNQETRVQLI